jgi:hemerythrin-like domain-containing protein
MQTTITSVAAVSPIENLMRAHSVLGRLLQIYENCLYHLHAGTELPDSVLTKSAELVRRFISDYHEKMEEEQIFPRFAKNRIGLGLVRTLIRQHRVGRKISGNIIALSRQDLRDPRSLLQLEGQIRLFERMYGPHAAREDTELFPALHVLCTDDEFSEMEEQFILRENEFFGQYGFDNVVAQVESLEKLLHLENLAEFTAPGIE